MPGYADIIAHFVACVETHIRAIFTRGFAIANVMKRSNACSASAKKTRAPAACGLSTHGVTCVETYIRPCAHGVPLFLM